MFKIDAKIKKSFHVDLKKWFLHSQRDLPWRNPRTPYAVTVSELMLQQTQVKTVIPYFQRWMKSYPDWSALAQASEQSVLKSWEGLGYYSRARNLHRIAQIVVREFQGKMPSSVEELLKLPGIGRYTAGAISSFAFGKRAPLVDGNVIRVFARFFACEKEVSQPQVIAQFWNLAEALLPTSDFDIHNESLMEIGALICTPQNPSCILCPLQKNCRGKTNPELYPHKKRAPSVKKKEQIAIIQDRQRFWLIPGTGRQSGFSLFPEFNPQKMKWIQNLGTLHYGFTKYRIEMTYGYARFKSQKNALPDGKWIPLKDLNKFPLPQAHRKIAHQLENIPLKILKE